MAANFRGELLAWCGDSGDYGQDLQLVDIVFEVVVIDAVYYRSAYCLNVAFAALGHIANDLQLCRGAFFELSAVEADLELSGVFSCLLEGVWAEFVLFVPIFD